MKNLAALAGQRANATIQLPDSESLWAAFATAINYQAEPPEFHAPRRVPNCERTKTFELPRHETAASIQLRAPLHIPVMGSHCSGL